jgi:hypothetical protein
VKSAGTHNVHSNDFYAKEKLLKSMRDCNPSSVRHLIVRVVFLFYFFVIPTIKLGIQYLFIIFMLMQSNNNGK